MPGKLRRWVLAGVALALLVVPCTVIIRSIVVSARRATCARNLQIIAQALFAYSFDPGANAQEAIETLVATGRLSPQRARCPSSGGRYHFILLRPPPSPKAESTTVVAYEPLSNHGGAGACVLYLDGRVIFEGPDRFKELIDESSRTMKPRDP